MESELENSSRLFVALLRQCSGGENLDTCNKFIALLAKHVPNSVNGGIESMFTEVQTLFGSKQYLIHHFSNFVEYYRQINKPSSPVKKETENPSSPVENEVPLSKNHPFIKDAVDLLNNARRTLKNQEQLERFVDVVASFEKPKDVVRVRKESLKLLENHPLLLREWSGFLAEGNIGNKSKAENYHDLMFDVEHAMHKMDLLFNRALSVKDSAKRLIGENLEKDPMEKIDVGMYFSTLDVRFVSIELKGCRHYLTNKFMRRGKAAKNAEKMVRCVEKKIKKLSRCTKKRKNLAFDRHAEDMQIPEFNWYDD